MLDASALSCFKLQSRHHLGVAVLLGADGQWEGCGKVHVVGSASASPDLSNAVGADPVSLHMQQLCFVGSCALLISVADIQRIVKYSKPGLCLCA